MSDHYCTIDDVNALVPQVPFNATSKPNEATVTSLIGQVATRMDASLVNLGYTVPVTEGTLSLALLREACTWGALGLAQQIRDTGVKTSVTESGRPMKNIWLQQFEGWMKQLADNDDPFELPDAARTDQQVEKQGEAIMRSSVQGVDDDTWLAPQVTRSQVL